MLVKELNEGPNEANLGKIELSGQLIVLKSDVCVIKTGYLICALQDLYPREFTFSNN